MVEPQQELDAGLLGTNVMLARRVLKLKQYEFAKVLKISPQALYRIESGTVSPPQDFYVKIYFVLREVTLDMEYCLSAEQISHLSRIISLFQSKAQNYLNDAVKIKTITVV